MSENGLCLMLLGGCVLVCLGAAGWLGVQVMRKRFYIDLEPGYAARNRKMNRESRRDR